MHEENVNDRRKVQVKKDVKQIALAKCHMTGGRWGDEAERTMIMGGRLTGMTG